MLRSRTKKSKDSIIRPALDPVSVKLSKSDVHTCFYNNRGRGLERKRIPEVFTIQKTFQEINSMSMFFWTKGGKTPNILLSNTQVLTLTVCRRFATHLWVIRSQTGSNRETDKPAKQLAAKFSRNSGGRLPAQTGQPPEKSKITKSRQKKVQVKVYPNRLHTQTHTHRKKKKSCTHTPWPAAAAAAAVWAAAKHIAQSDTRRLAQTESKTVRRCDTQLPVSIIFNSNQVCNS